MIAFLDKLMPGSPPIFTWSSVSKSCIEVLSDCPKAGLTVHPKVTAKIIKKDRINAYPLRRALGVPRVFRSAYTMHHPVHELSAFPHHDRCSIHE